MATESMLSLLDYISVITNVLHFLRSEFVTELVEALKYC